MSWQERAYQYFAAANASYDIKTERPRSRDLDLCSVFLKYGWKGKGI